MDELRSQTGGNETAQRLVTTGNHHQLWVKASKEKENVPEIQGLGPPSKYRNHSSQSNET